MMNWTQIGFFLIKSPLKLKPKELPLVAAGHFLSEEIFTTTKMSISHFSTNFRAQFLCICSLYWNKINIKFIIMCAQVSFQLNSICHLNKCVFSRWLSNKKKKSENKKKWMRFYTFLVRVISLLPPLKFLMVLCFYLFLLSLNLPRSRNITVVLWFHIEIHLNDDKVTVSYPILHVCGAPSDWAGPYPLTPDA